MASRAAALMNLLGQESLAGSQAMRETERNKLERERLRAQLLSNFAQQGTQAAVGGLQAAAQSVSGLTNALQQQKAQRLAKARQQVIDEITGQQDELLKPSAEEQRITPKQGTQVEFQPGAPPIPGQEKMSPREALVQDLTERYKGRVDPAFIKARIAEAAQARQQQGLQDDLTRAKTEKLRRIPQTQKEELSFGEKQKQVKQLITPGYLETLEPRLDKISADAREEYIANEVRRATGIDLDDDAIMAAYNDAKAEILEGAAEADPKKEANTKVITELQKHRNDYDLIVEPIRYLNKNKEKIQFDKLAELEELMIQGGAPARANIGGGRSVSAGLLVAGFGPGASLSKNLSIGGFAVDQDAQVKLQEKLMELNPETRAYVNKIMVAARQQGRAIEAGRMTDQDWLFYTQYLANPFRQDQKVVQERLNSAVANASRRYANAVQDYGYTFDISPQHREFARAYAKWQRNDPETKDEYLFSAEGIPSTAGTPQKKYEMPSVEERTGVNVEEFKEGLEINVDEIQKDFEDHYRAHGAVEKKPKTLSDLWNDIKDRVAEPGEKRRKAKKQAQPYFDARDDTAEIEGELAKLKRKPLASLKTADRIKINALERKLDLAKNKEDLMGGDITNPDLAIETFNKAVGPDDDVNYAAEKLLEAMGKKGAEKITIVQPRTKLEMTVPVRQLDRYKRMGWEVSKWQTAANATTETDPNMETDQPPIAENR